MTILIDKIVLRILIEMRKCSLCNNVLCTLWVLYVFVVNGLYRVMKEFCNVWCLNMRNMEDIGNVLILEIIIY